MFTNFWSYHDFKSIDDLIYSQIFDKTVYMQNKISVIQFVLKLDF